jgi:hypothetical protein
MVGFQNAPPSEISPPGSYTTYSILILTILRYSRFEFPLTFHQSQTTVPWSPVLDPKKPQNGSFSKNGLLKRHGIPKRYRKANQPAGGRANRPTDQPINQSKDQTTDLLTDLLTDQTTD